MSSRMRARGERSADSVGAGRKMCLPMPLAAASATARQYRILVPAGVALRMVLSSTSFGDGPRIFRRDGTDLIGALRLPRGTAKAELKVRVRARKEG